MKLTFLDDFFGIVRIFFNGTLLERRRIVEFAGDAVTSVDDDPANDRIVVTILAGGSGRRGKATIAGDANHTLTTPELANAIISVTGDAVTGLLTADRTFTFGAPATDADAYTRIFRNDSDPTSAGNAIASTGTGATIAVPPGCSVTLGFDTGGVFVANTGAP